MDTPDTLAGMDTAAGQTVADVAFRLLLRTDRPSYPASRDTLRQPSARRS